MLKARDFVSARELSGWFVNAADRDAGEAITHLKVQKLVYYAQAWFLANFDRPIFEEEMEAWTHGPVAPSVYDKYRGKRFESLPLERQPRVPLSLEPFLKEIQKEYGQFTAKRLEFMTHAEGPWIETRGALPLEAKCTRPISKLSIRNFYAARLGKKPIKKLPHQ
jgi:uncharacterized phage-associated protein